jgi:hypothetical protein
MALALGSTPRGAIIKEVLVEINMLSTLHLIDKTIRSEGCISLPK